MVTLAPRERADVAAPVGPPQNKTGHSPPTGAAKSDLSQGYGLGEERGIRRF